MRTILLLLLLYIGLVYSAGDTYPLTDNISFRNEVKPSFGLVAQVNRVNPLQLQFNLMWANYFVAGTGSYSSTPDQNEYGATDTRAGQETQFEGAYFGYVPGEFRIDVFDTKVSMSQYLAVGLGWQHTSQLYQDQVQPQGRWDTRLKFQLGTTVDYKRLGFIAAVGTGRVVFMGLKFNLY